MRMDEGKLTQPQPRCLLFEDTTRLSLWEQYLGTQGGFMATVVVLCPGPKSLECLSLRDFIAFFYEESKVGLDKA